MSFDASKFQAELERQSEQAFNRAQVIDDPAIYGEKPSEAAQQTLNAGTLTDSLVFVLWAQQVDVSKLSPDQMTSILAALATDSLIRDAIVGGRLNSAQIDELITKEMFNPTESSDSGLLSTGLGLLASQGHPLSSAQQNYLSTNTSQIPAPFDRAAITGYGYGFDAPDPDFASGVHEGVDYDMNIGTALYTPFAGTVIEAGAVGGYGNMVTVKLTNGWELRFAHLSNFAVAQGQRVNPGDLLGESGMTGNTTGPHVHVEWRDPSGAAHDPNEIFNPIWSGATFASLGISGAQGTGVSDAAAKDRLLGIDPILSERYPGAVTLWKKYFGNDPTGQQLLGVVGDALGAPTQVGAGVQSSYIADLARQAGFPEDQIPTAVAVALAESGGNPNAVGDVSLGGSIGLWQIFTKAHPDLAAKYNLNDPLQNAKAAFEVWSNAGGSWTPWSTFNNGAYRGFLGQQGPLVASGGKQAQLDMNQIEDRIRGMPSHVPGISVGQYSDVRSTADSVSMKMFGHSVTDGMVKEMIDGRMTDPTSVQYYLEHLDISGKMPKDVYASYVAANAPYMRSIYAQPGQFDSRIAISQHAAAQQQGVPVPTTPDPATAEAQVTVTGPVDPHELEAGVTNLGPRPTWRSPRDQPD